MPELTIWTIGIRAIDHTDLDEHITITSDAGWCNWFDEGVVIQTEPTGLGDFNVERVIPWTRVIEYRKERRAAADGTPEEPTCECGAAANDISFDRSICACGAMHYYCNSCGTQAEPCADEAPHG